MPTGRNQDMLGGLFLAGGKRDGMGVLEGGARIEGIDARALEQIAVDTFEAVKFCVQRAGKRRQPGAASTRWRDNDYP